MQENQCVPFVVHEADMSRMERTIKRLWIGLLIALFLIAASNIAWIIYLSQYDCYSAEYSQDGEGVNIIGDENGVDYYGAEAESQKENTEK